MYVNVYGRIIYNRQLVNGLSIVVYLYYGILHYNKK